MKLTIRKGTFKHVEDELFAYLDTHKEIQRLRTAILYPTSHQDDNIGGGRGNLPGDPTGRAATALATNTRLQHLESIVQTIEHVYKQLPPDKQRLVQLYYWTKPQLMSWDGIALKLNCNRATAIRWRNEVVAAVSQAIGWR